MKKILLIIVLGMYISPCFAQSCTDVKESLRKRHTISGMTYGHPYTMFDRHNGFSLEVIISNIRQNFINDTMVRDAYKKIYDNAKLNRPTDNGIINGDAPSALAIWAKNNAFVFLVGLNANGNKLDTYTYSASLSLSGFAIISVRNIVHSQTMFYNF